LLSFLWGIYSDSKLDQLRELAGNSIQFKPTFDQFKEYIVTGPREYSVLLFFTSGNSTWCQACPLIKEELDKLSTSYTTSENPEERDFFIAYIEFESHKSYYNYKDQIYSIPSLMMIQKTTKKGTQFTVNDKDRFIFQQDFSAEAVAKFINLKLGPNKIKIPEADMTNVYLVGFLVGFVLISFIYSNRSKKALWLVMSLLFPWFTYTGTYFNLSHMPPFVYKQGTSSTIIFPSQQMQTISEGLLVSTLILFMGVVFALFFTTIPEVRYGLRRLLFYPLILLMGGLLYFYFEIWKIKSPWYFGELFKLSYLQPLDIYLHK